MRYAAELGYEFTVVKDATASYSEEHMHAALEVNLPNYASAVVPQTKSSVASLLLPPWKSPSGPNLRLKRDQTFGLDLVNND